MKGADGSGSSAVGGRHSQANATPPQHSENRSSSGDTIAVDPNVPIPILRTLQSVEEYCKGATYRWGNGGKGGNGAALSRQLQHGAASSSSSTMVNTFNNNEAEASLRLQQQLIKSKSGETQHSSAGRVLPSSERPQQQPFGDSAEVQAAPPPPTKRRRLIITPRTRLITDQLIAAGQVGELTSEIWESLNSVERSSSASSFRLKDHHHRDALYKDFTCPLQLRDGTIVHYDICKADLDFLKHHQRELLFARMGNIPTVKLKRKVVNSGNGEVKLLSPETTSGDTYVSPTAAVSPGLVGAVDSSRSSSRAPSSVSSLGGAREPPAMSRQSNSNNSGGGSSISVIGGGYDVGSPVSSNQGVGPSSLETDSGCMIFADVLTDRLSSQDEAPIEPQLALALEEKFVILIDQWEKSTGVGAPIGLEIAIAIARSLPQVESFFTNWGLKLIYSHWLSRRAQLEKPLLRHLWASTAVGSTPSAYVVFRSRQRERMSLRRPRRTLQGAWQKFEFLLRDLTQVEKLLKLVIKRDKAKLALAELNACLFEQIRHEVSDRTYVSPYWNYLKETRYAKLLNYLRSKERWLDVCTGGIQPGQFLRSSEDSTAGALKSFLQGTKNNNTILSRVMPAATRANEGDDRADVESDQHDKRKLLSTDENITPPHLNFTITDAFSANFPPGQLADQPRQQMSPATLATISDQPSSMKEEVLDVNDQTETVVADGKITAIQPVSRTPSVLYTYLLTRCISAPVTSNTVFQHCSIGRDGRVWAKYSGLNRLKGGMLIVPTALEVLENKVDRRQDLMLENGDDVTESRSGCDLNTRSGTSVVVAPTSGISGSLRQMPMYRGVTDWSEPQYGPKGSTLGDLLSADSSTHWLRHIARQCRLLYMLDLLGGAGASSCLNRDTDATTQVAASTGRGKAATGSAVVGSSKLGAKRSASSAVEDHHRVISSKRHQTYAQSAATVGAAVPNPLSSFSGSDHDEVDRRRSHAWEVNRSGNSTTTTTFQRRRNEPSSVIANDDSLDFDL